MHIHHLPRNLFPVPVLAEPESKLALHTPKLASEGEARESTTLDYRDGTRVADSRGGENTHLGCKSGLQPTLITTSDNKTHVKSLHVDTQALTKLRDRLSYVLCVKRLLTQCHADAIALSYELLGPCQNIQPSG
jgi:hypothetical protein